ncbi:MAG: homocysteine S-methyltransferase family protein [Alistipes sp.]|nr:homocysteine S-methyltransferase family protein [Alistipes sp.]MDE7128709.1 homocysteine S-methyltransferase family protein [Alistipes sp.]
MGILRDMMRERIVIADGATGTMLAARAGDKCCDLLAVEQPDAVEALHADYIAAGADMITTDTFCSDPLTLAEWHLEDRCEQIVRAAVGAARRAADKAGRRILVAGSVGPTVRNISLSTDVTEQQLREAYARQIGALIDSGVDVVLIESVCDVRNAVIAAEECRRLLPDMDLVVTATLSKIKGHLVSGRPIDRFVDDMKKIAPAAVGFNCSYGAVNVADNISLMAEKCDFALAAMPSAGVPDASGRFPDSERRFVDVMESLASCGRLNIAGGCCGTTPGHIAALAEMCRRYEPRKI